MHRDTSTEHHFHDEGHEVHAHQPHTPFREELVTHLPFSVSSVAVGLVVAGVICFLSPGVGRDLTASPPGAGKSAAAPESARQHTEAGAHPQVDRDAAARSHDHDHASGFRPLFHLFHPVHMFFSAAATTAMFWRYERRFLKAIVVGLVGAIGVCGISDIAMPHVSLHVLGKPLPIHICVIEHPGLVMPFAVIGVGVGLLAAVGVARSTIFSHSIHVFVSTMASIFYMIHGYGRLAWIDDIGWIFFFIVLAVMVPCCLSDIVFPLAMSKTARTAYAKSACCH